MYIISDYVHSLPGDMIPKDIVTFKRIIPVSVHSGEGIGELITTLRNVLDEDAEKKIEPYHRKQLQSLHLSEI